VLIDMFSGGCSGCSMHENFVSEDIAGHKPNLASGKLSLAQQRLLLEQELVDYELMILELAEQRVTAMQRFVYLCLEFTLVKGSAL
jgi:hypothetical protein